MTKKLRQRATIGGKQQWLTGSTQQEIFDAYLEQAVQAGVVSMGGECGSVSASSPLFKTCAWRWFEIYKVPNVRENTAYNYRCDMEKHILPAFGKHHINTIKPSEIQAFLNSKQDKAHSTVHRLWLILHGIFSMAMWDGYIDKDPTEDAKRYTMSQKKSIRNALSAADTSDIIRSLPNLQANDRLLLALLSFTGMRRSEALGLRWEDIDFSLGLIHIQRTATFRGNRPVVGPTKSAAGVRYIPLGPQFRAILLPLRQYSGYLIGQNEPITQMTYKRTWERIGKTINLHDATAHILRHTYITMAVPHADIKTLRSIAGHADICTTMNRYAHGRVDKVIEAGRALEGMFLG